MAARKRRLDTQVPLFATAPCDHGVTVEVKNGAGEIVGEQCTVCLENVAGYGLCAGCGLKGRLTYVAEDGKQRVKRYCTRGCRTVELGAAVPKAAP